MQDYEKSRQVCGECRHRASTFEPVSEGSSKMERVYFCTNADSLDFNQDTPYSHTCSEWAKK